MSGSPSAERLVEQQHSPGDLVPSGLVAVLLGDPEEAARNSSRIGRKGTSFVCENAVRLVDRDLARATALGELVAEPALSRSRFGDHADDLRVPRNRLLERGVQSRHLALASDELGEAACAGDVEAAVHAAHALELEDVQRIVHSFDPSFTKVAELKVTRDQLRSVLGEIGRVGGRDLLHPRRQVGRMSKRRVVHPQIVANLPDHDLSRVEAHAYREADPFADTQLVRVAA